MNSVAKPYWSISMGEQAETRTNRHIMKNGVIQLVVTLGLLGAGSVAIADAPLVYCNGTACGGDGPRRYAYPVDAASFPMIEFRVGTNDLDLENYTDILIPDGWSFAVEAEPMSHMCGVSTPHGKGSPGPCRSLTLGSVHWWVDDPHLAVESFIFGYDHPGSSEDVGWTLRTRREGSPPTYYTMKVVWDSTVGTGYGPLHGPTLESEGLVGDLNNDGLVSSGDLDIVRGHWGESVEPGNPLQGDPSGDGLVNSKDLDVIRANWGSQAAAVPEPGMVLLVLLGAALSVLRRR